MKEFTKQELEEAKRAFAENCKCPWVSIRDKFPDMELSDKLELYCLIYNKVKNECI